MKHIILIDWSDDQSKMPAKPNWTQAALDRSRRVMTSFESWRKKGNTRQSDRLVLWHTHFPDRFMEPPSDENPPPFDCRANLFEKQIEAIAKNYSAEEPILLADDSFVFTDDFDVQPYIKQAESFDNGVIIVNNAWILSPQMQYTLGGLAADPNCDRFVKDWTESDFKDWTHRATWTFAKTYAENAPHEYAAYGKPDTELSDLYCATMFILRNGFVQMFYKTPFMAYETEGHRYWAYSSYTLVNRTLAGDLKTYQ